jgi:hypothetical protein
MLLYSKTTISFIQKIKARSRAIMAQEMGLRFKTSRFEYNGYNYPLHFVVFDDPNKLGYFDCSNYQIGLHKNLMLIAKDQVIDNILRHELAHLYTFLKHPKSFYELNAHGQEFQEVCRAFKWGADIARAKSSLELDNASAESTNEMDRHLKRLQKLLSLASSSNPHEAQAATIKANELLLKYNLSQIRSISLDDEIACVKKVLQKKRADSKLNAIYQILSHFYVRPVLSRQNSSTSLEVVGTRHNVELADYIAKYLDLEFEHFWQNASSGDPTLKGVVKKNNYITGLASGFIDKLTKERSNRNIIKEESKGLILINQQLERLTQYAYPSLRKVRHKGSQDCPTARSKGIKDGGRLSLRAALKNTKKILLLE